MPTAGENLLETAREEVLNEGGPARLQLFTFIRLLLEAHSRPGRKLPGVQTSLCAGGRGATCPALIDQIVRGPKASLKSQAILPLGVVARTCCLVLTPTSHS